MVNKIRRKRVYVAGKLNDMACAYIQNVYKMCTAAERVRKAGFAVFVPGIDLVMGLIHGNWTYEDYFENSQPWLDASDAVFVTASWKTSVGTRREIERAEAQGIPVFYTLAALVEWNKEQGDDNGSNSIS